MAVPRKLIIAPNAATRELWRIAESGAIDELEDVLPQAQINTPNEHGMTALMRAARHGRVQMVRVLLEHGADPNVVRSDNFTALSLAAFFGHGEVVELLIGHGANADVATRFDTSPYLWAKARSFGDVARSLEQRNDDQKKPVLRQPVTPQAVTAQPAPRAREEDPGQARYAEGESPEPLVVRTLKDPPEIWDLVHEAPRNFNARSAFIARLGATKGVAVLTLALVVLAGGAVTAWMFFEGKISLPTLPAASATTTGVPAAPATKTTKPPSVTAPAVNQSAEPNNIVPENAAIPTGPVPLEIEPVVPRRSRPFPRSRSISTSVNDEAETLSKPVQPTAVAVPKVDPPVNKEAEAKKTNAPPSTQVIAPPKSSQSPKPKVIQWP